MERLEAQNYDRGMWLPERAGLRMMRQRLLAQAEGSTLEIGTGTGANLPLYQPDIRVTAVELRPAHLAAAANKARRNGRHQVTVACADAMDLPFARGSFDTVVGTLVFCSIREPSEALAEIRRVLRPGGQLLLLEHVRGQTALTRRLTDWLHPLWFAMQGECHLNRETAATVATAGFRLESVASRFGGLLQILRAVPI